MRVLVTGGAGYVGSHAAKQLVKSGHDVLIVDNLAEGHRPAVGKLPFVSADLLDRDRDRCDDEGAQDRSRDALRGVRVRRRFGHATRPSTITTTSSARSRCSDAMRTAGVDRIVFSSSCATYGIPERVPITEDHPQNPISPYGFTKLVIEHALADYSHAYGLGYAALRYFNASGAAADGTIGEDHDPETHLIPLMLQVALGQREYVDIFGTDYPTPDGTCIRDYIHVDDLATAHVAALEKLKPGMELKLNLGTGHGASVQEVIDLCREVTGHPIPARKVGRREGDPPALVADASAAKRELNWQARYSMREIVESAWTWHSKHPRGYGD